MKTVKFEFEVRDLSNKEISIIEKEMQKLIGKKLIKSSHIEIKIEEIDPSLVIKSKPIDYNLSCDEWLKVMDESNNHMININQLAIERGLLVGRVIQFPIGDGYACYQIISKSGDEVSVQAITGLGDDWMIHDIGHSGVIPLQRAKSHLMRGKNERLFGFK